jgi:FkbM family methyltransferase
MKYWVYMPLWNDADLVRIILKHYETADRIIFYDAGSTDDGPDIAIAARREVRYFKETTRLSDKTNIEMKNHAWKEAVGHADYVIVSDTDELIFFPAYPNDIIGALSMWKENRVTHSDVISFAVIMKDEEITDTLSRLSINQQPTLSIHKVSREDPILLYAPVSHNVQVSPYLYDKSIIFNPNAIAETNFQLGQHDWAPHFKQNPIQPPWKPIMLHYRYLGETREFTRTQATRERIKHQFPQKQGLHYKVTDQQIRDRIKFIYSQGTTVDLFAGFKRVIGFKGAKDFLCYCHEEPDYISNQITKGLTWEPTVSAAIAALCGPGTLFVDIGANIGLHSFTAAIRGAKVIAFESHPKTCSLLRKSVHANGWANRISVREVACSDSDGQFLNLTDDPHNMGGSSVEIKGSGSVHKVITTRIDTQDIISSTATNVVIKIDIEGHEEFAIKGMTKTLQDNRVSAIIVEFNSMIKSAQTLMNNVYDKLINLGFSDVRILLQHPPDKWEGSPIHPKLPERIPNTKNIVLSALSKGAVVELLFLRNYK